MRLSGSSCFSVWAYRSPRPLRGPRSGSSPRFFMIPWPQNYYCILHMMRFYLKRNDLDLVDLPIDDDAVDDADRRCRCRRQNVFQRRRHHLRFRFRLSAGRALLQKPEHFNAESFFRTSLPFPALFFKFSRPNLFFYNF